MVPGEIPLEESESDGMMDQVAPLPRDTRALRRLRKYSHLVGAGSARSASGPSFLEEQAVLPRTWKEYKRMVMWFLQFAEDLGLDVSKPEGVDAAMVEFLTQPLSDGIGVSKGLLRARRLASEYPEVLEQWDLSLPRSSRILWSWKRLAPVRC